MIIPSINSILKCEKLEPVVVSELVNKLDISEDDVKDKSKKFGFECLTAGQKAKLLTEQSLHDEKSAIKKIIGEIESIGVFGKT